MIDDIAVRVEEKSQKDFSAHTKHSKIKNYKKFSILTDMLTVVESVDSMRNVW